MKYQSIPIGSIPRTRGDEPKNHVVILILLVLITLTLTGYLSKAQSPPAIYFTDNMAATGTSPNVTPLEQALLDRINTASTRIDAAIYDFNRASIRDALIAAHNRGVAVRVVTDDEARFHIDSYIPYYQALVTAGIPVKDDQRPSTIMHHKYFIIDEAAVWTGSTNMSDNGFTKNHNNAIVWDAATVATIYQAEFNQLWAGSFSIHKTASVTTSTAYNGRPLEIYFSPNDKAMDQIITQVEAAQVSIDFAIFFFTDDGLRDALIRDALIRARRRGVTIRGLWDNLGASNSFSDDETLCAAGIPIKLEDTIGKLHHKFMVIDADGPNPRLITGSMNWTNAGDGGNDENTIIYHDKSSTQAYADTFQNMWDALAPETQCELPPDSTDHSIYLPLIMGGGDGGSGTLPTPSATPVTPTPIPTPVPTATAPGGAAVKLVSILYNPDGNDADGEYVTLHNQGSSDQDMIGWELSDEVGTTYLFGNFNLPAGNSVKVWVKVGSDTATDLYWGRGSAVWNNGGDVATLQNAKGVTIDVCAYPGGGKEALCN